jgi:prefoldin subunit 5
MYTREEIQMYRTFKHTTKERTRNEARREVRREIEQLSRDRETVKKGLLWYTQRINTLREELSLLEEE